MKVLIRDTWFPPKTRIAIGAGADELSFVRCTFVGGEIAIEHDVDRRIFSNCLFKGTVFSVQSLSERTSQGCRWIAPTTEPG